jgi:hypothetical protein
MGGTTTGSPATVQGESAYATYAQVTARNPRIFVTAGAPTQAQVNTWLAEGAIYIDAKLANAGYSTPVASTVDAFGLLRNLNTTFAAAMAEQTRSVSSTDAVGNTRGDILLNSFYKGIDNLLLLDLSSLGIGYTSVAYAGGWQESDKEAVEEESDRLMTTFKRGQFAYPGAGTTRAGATIEDEEA